MAAPKPAAKPATTTATPNRISIPYPRVSWRQGKDLTLKTIKPIGLAVAHHFDLGVETFSSPHETRRSARMQPFAIDDGQLLRERPI